MRVQCKNLPIKNDLQGTAATTSTPAPTLRTAPTAQARPPRVGHQPHEREEAALGAGGEL